MVSVLASKSYLCITLVTRTTESLTLGAPSNDAFTVTESPIPAVALYGAHISAVTVLGASTVQ